MTISITSIFKDSAKFSGINILSKVIQFPVSIIIANVLGPLEYGILGYAMLFLTYAGWFTFNAMGSAFREMPGLIKRKRFNEAIKKQNISFTIDTATSLIVFVTLIIIALLHKNIVHRNLIFLISIFYLVSYIRNIFGVINIAYQRYNLAAKAKLFPTFLGPVLLLSLIYITGVYTPIIVSIIVTFVVVLFLFKKEKYKLSFRYKKKDSYIAVKTGVQLNLTTILYNLFSKTADLTIISLLLPKTELGLYLFALKLYQIFDSIIADFSRVLQPQIWAVADVADSTQEGFASLKKMAVIFSIFCSLSIGILHLGFMFIVNILAPKYIDSQWVFLIIISYTFWSTQAMFPYFVLMSARVNKQNLMNVLWIVALVANIILDLFAVMMGYGIVGIAFATTISQLIFTTMQYYYAGNYMFINRMELIRFLVRVLFPFSIPMFITGFHWYTINTYSLAEIIFSSLIIQTLVWIVFIHLFYGDYINKQIIVSTYSNVQSSVSRYLSKIKKTK